ncbi:MAG: response regulator transcription factor [Elusimicrobia bacterium]|nr:response regulator transcription factor [Elusimicrobiota bacterium]
MRILLIEDEKKIANFIKRGLKEENYAVDMAFDGLEGLNMVNEASYDLVILDLMLPSFDGISICSTLRKNGFNAPILMLTAKDRIEDKVKGLDSGANDYLTKPFAFEELLARIRVLLRHKPSQSANIKIKDLEIDLVSHRAKRAEKNIVLSAKEFALLEYLARNEGKLVTRTMISEHVWDIHFDTDTNVIDVHINHLRKKIDRSHLIKLIHTIRGRGYILNPP